MIDRIIKDTKGREQEAEVDNGEVASVSYVVYADNVADVVLNMSESLTRQGWEIAEARAMDTGSVGVEGSGHFVIATNPQTGETVQVTIITTGTLHAVTLSYPSKLRDK